MSLHLENEAVNNLAPAEVLSNHLEYGKNPLYKEKEFGDYTAFYVTITICTVFGFGIFLLNIFFCWCSKHKDYWQDSNTGNRWILPIWTKTPHGQPPLDLTELEVELGKGGAESYTRAVYQHPQLSEESHELEPMKRESQL